MKYVGGLITHTDGNGNVRYEKTDKYLSVKVWLAGQKDVTLIDAHGTWIKHKREQRRVRRVVGPRNPLSPSKLKRLRQDLWDKAAQTAEAEQQRKQAS